MAALEVFVVCRPSRKVRCQAFWVWQACCNPCVVTNEAAARVSLTRDKFGKWNGEIRRLGYAASFLPAPEDGDPIKRFIC